MEMIRLEDVLARVDGFRWDYALHLPNGEWSLETRGAVLDPTDAESADDVPPFALENGLRSVLGMQAVQDVVANARAQKHSATALDLLQALRFYFERDAFIEF